MARFHADSGFSQEAFKSQSGSARAWMPFADLNGTKSSDCLLRLRRTQWENGSACLRTTSRQTRLLFSVYHEYDEVRTPPIQYRNVLSGRFYLYGSQSCSPNQARETHCSCRHRRSSTPGGSERGEDPALPTEEGSG